MMQKCEDLQNLTLFLDEAANSPDEAVRNSPILKMSETGATYTPGEVLKKMSAAASVFKSCGISPGDRILIYLNNSAEYLFSYLAAWRMGAIAVPANRVLTLPELRYFIDQAGVSLVVTDDAGRKMISSETDQPETGPEACLPDVKIVTDVMIRDFPESEEIFEAYMCPPETVCQIQYTSGTTGRPKGAMLTQGGWSFAMDAAAAVLRLGKGDVYLGIYPMAHVGLVWGFAAMKAGCPFVEMERYVFDRYISLIEENAVTIAAGMPPVIHSILTESQKPEDGGKLKKRLSTVRGIISGGGVLHHEIWKPFHETFGIPIYNAYGLSETIVVGTGTCIVPEDYPFADRYRSVGRPSPGTDLFIVDTEDPDRILPDGEIGEVALRGPAVAAGYWNMPEETKKSFLEDGRFLTGDIGFIDKDGRLSIVDRKKEMVVMSGWKIYPTEVESVLLNHPLVLEAAVFGIPDIHRTEIPVAAVVLRNKECSDQEKENASAELEKYCRENLAVYKVPRKFFFIDELPRVNGWKLLRRDLQKRFGNIS